MPADLRLFETNGLRIEEASLTGESIAVDKTTEPILDGELPLGDRFNMAYKSTQVTNGRARGVVVSTGMVQRSDRSPACCRKKKAAHPCKNAWLILEKYFYLILFICMLLFVVGLLRGEEPLRMLLVAISLAVAAIPEAVPR